MGARKVEIVTVAVRLPKPLVGKLDSCATLMRTSRSGVLAQFIDDADLALLDEAEPMDLEDQIDSALDGFKMPPCECNSLNCDACNASSERATPEPSIPTEEK